MKRCPKYWTFPTADADRWLSISVTSDAEWKALTAIIGQPHLADDPRFATQAKRYANRRTLDAPIGDWTAGQGGEAAAERHGALVDRMIDIIVTEMNRPGPFDFGDRGFVEVLREQGMEMAADRSTWHIPPVETLFVQRKVSGTALLAARLEARVDVRELVRPYLEEGAG